MDDPRWLRIIVVGLVLAALAVGYYLISGTFSLKSAKPQTKTPTPSTPVVAGATSSPQSAYQKIVERNQAQVQTLPNTGLPVGFIGLLSIAIMITGLGLRKFPN